MAWISGFGGTRVEAPAHREHPNVQKGHIRERLHRADAREIRRLPVIPSQPLTRGMEDRRKVCKNVLHTLYSV